MSKDYKSDNHNGWTKTIIKDGQIYESVNGKAFKERGYPVPRDPRPGREKDALHTHTNVGEGSKQIYHRDWYGNETKG